MVTWIARYHMTRLEFEVAYEIIRVRDGRIYSETIIPWSDIPCEQA